MPAAETLQEKIRTISIYLEHEHKCVVGKIDESFYELSDNIFINITIDHNTGRLTLPFCFEIMHIQVMRYSAAQLQIKVSISECEGYFFNQHKPLK